MENVAMKIPKSVLFVDDDPELLSGLRRALRPWSEEYELLFLCGGSAGLQTLHRRHIDVVVTDWAMPLTHGQTLIEKGHAIRPDTAFIVLSGNAQPETVQKLTQESIVYLAKPASPAVLMQAVEDAIDWLESRQL